MRLANRYLFIALTLILANAAQAANLSWDRTEARLEMGPDQTDISATFTVTNQSDEILRIDRVKTSCGCTGSVTSKKIIEPGESAEIVGSFNRGKRKGKVTNKLLVYLDGKPDPVATLHMIVQIPSLLDLQPAIVYWTQKSDQKERRVQVDLDERYLTELSSIEYDTTKLKVTEEEDPTGEADTILVIEPLSFSEVIREPVKIVASGPDGRETEGKVMVFVQP